jgi:hypothetical protein
MFRTNIYGVKYHRVTVSKGPGVRDTEQQTGVGPEINELVAGRCEQEATAFIVEKLDPNPKAPAPPIVGETRRYNGVERREEDVPVDHERRGIGSTSEHESDEPAPRTGRTFNKIISIRNVLQGVLVDGEDKGYKGPDRRLAPAGVGPEGKERRAVAKA